MILNVSKKPIGKSGTDPFILPEMARARFRGLLLAHGPRR